MRNPIAITAACTLALITTAGGQNPPSPSPIGSTFDRVHRPIAPQVRSTLTKITVKIEDGIASTQLSETIRNDGGRPAEADWILPLPPGATADGFEMLVGGVVQTAEILPATKARGIYEEIVRRRRDPGLLEYVDCGMIRARVFPIPPNGSIEVRVRWRHVLPESGGLHSYVFPLRAAGLGGRPVDKIALDLTIHSRVPLKSVWSPLSTVEIQKKSDHEARVGFELDGGQLATRDLEVFYGTSAEDFGLTFLPFRAGGRDGHFLLMVTPKQEWPEDPNTVRVVQFVVDTSGSMQGKKIEQARNALEFFVNSLHPTDRFNIIPFSTEARPFFAGAVAADPSNLGKARERISAIEARGGTNIDEAMAAALRSATATDDPALEGKSLVPIVVFLTDGLPTVGETDVNTLLAKHVRTRDGRKPRFFVFGVGNDVNTRLLDAMAAETRGDRDYVREHEDIEVKTGALFTKLSHPVLTDVQLVFDGITVEALEPKDLPDLFRGSRLLVFGRYKGEGAHAIRLKGKVGGADKEVVYETTFPAEATQHDFVASLWAQRRVARLLDAIRLNGAQPELVDEVTALGREYGITTPYTSHLIVEEGMALASSRGLRTRTAFFLGDDDGADDLRLREELGRAGFAHAEGLESPAERAKKLDAEGEKARDRFGGLAGAPAAGGEAVDTSTALLRLAQVGGPATPGPQGSIEDSRRSGAGMVVQRFAGRTFVLVGGVWVDQAFTAEMKGKEQKLVAFSDEYFALLRAHKDFAKLFAFSTRVVVVIDGTAIEIVEAE